MAKHQPTKTKTTHHDPKPTRQPEWKRDRYEQRKLKVSTRRHITGGF